MSGFKDIIKKDHLEALARRETILETVMEKRLTALHEEHELLYQAVLNPWPARWKNIVARLGKK
jgi:hypothetical protein